MPALDKRKSDQRFIGMFVGRSGSGKTVAAVSFPKPVEVEDFDGRIGGAQIEENGKQVLWLPLKDVNYNYYPPRKEGMVQELNDHLEQLNNNYKLAPAIQVPVTHVTDSITNECYAFICQSIPLTHWYTDEKGKKTPKGRWIGAISMSGPEDYGFESQGIADYVSWLKTLPIPNIIITAHFVDVYGKPKDENGNELPYANSEVVGKKLSIRDKIGENIQTHFDHIFEFERKKDRFFVTFKGGDMARTSWSWLPKGEKEWTGKNFHQFMMSFKKEQPSAEEKL